MIRVFCQDQDNTIYLRAFLIIQTQRKEVDFSQAKPNYIGFKERDPMFLDLGHINQLVLNQNQ
jgi:hypothetical protein